MSLCDFLRSSSELERALQFALIFCIVFSQSKDDDDDFDNDDTKDNDNNDDTDDDDDAKSSKGLSTDLFHWPFSQD